jgi:hypothetical protein
MTKIDLASQPSRLPYAQGSTPHEVQLQLEPVDEEQQKQEKGRGGPKRTRSKDKSAGSGKPEPDRSQAPQPLPSTPTTGPPQFPRPPPSRPTDDRRLGEFLTRRQAAEFIRNELGRPISFSTASKLAALGEFAEPALWWGRRPLYTREELRIWTEARGRATKERA